MGKMIIKLKDILLNKCLFLQHLCFSDYHASFSYWQGMFKLYKFQFQLPALVVLSLNVSCGFCHQKEARSCHMQCGLQEPTEQLVPNLWGLQIQ